MASIASIQAENAQRKVVRYTRQELVALAEQLKRDFPDLPRGRPRKGEARQPPDPERERARVLMRKYRNLVRKIDEGVVFTIALPGRD